MWWCCLHLWWSFFHCKLLSQNILTTQNSLHQFREKCIEWVFRFSSLEWWTEAVVTNYPAALQFHLQPNPKTHRAWDCCGIQFTFRWEIPNENTSLGPTLLSKNTVGSQAFSFSPSDVLLMSKKRSSSERHIDLLYFSELRQKGCWLWQAIWATSYLPQNFKSKHVKPNSKVARSTHLTLACIVNSRKFQIVENYEHQRLRAGSNLSRHRHIWVWKSHTGICFGENRIHKLTEKEKCVLLLDKMCSGNSDKGRITFQLVLIPRLLSQN